MPRCRPPLPGNSTHFHQSYTARNRALVTAAVTTIPSRAPESTSLIGSPPNPLAMICDIRVPVLPVSSSLYVVRYGEPLLFKTGASFTAVTAM